MPTSTLVQDAMRRLLSVKRWQDLFKRTGKEAKNHFIERIKDEYRKMATFVHPDKNTSPDAAKAFDILTKFKDDALEALDPTPVEHIRPDGVLAKPVSFKTRRFTYHLTNLVHRGGTCLIYEGVQMDKFNTGCHLQTFARVPRNPKDNDLMDREAKVFGVLKKKLKEIAEKGPEGEQAAKKFMWRIPFFVEQFKMKADSGTVRHVNLFTKIGGVGDLYSNGWYTLEQIRHEYPKGISIQQMAWIWNRILEGLTFLSHCNIVHGAITPNHILVHPKTHTGNIIDFTASPNIIDKLHAGAVGYSDSRYKAYFPPEMPIANDRSDVYMSAWCMIYLLGGDPNCHLQGGGFCEIFRGVPYPDAKITALLNRCLQPAAHMRMTAVRVRSEFQAILLDLFGPPKFTELLIPNPNQTNH